MSMTATRTTSKNDGHNNVAVSVKLCGRHCLWPSLYRLDNGQLQILQLAYY